jgi:hypothetical protein
MDPSFIPNGGREFSLGRSYESHRALVNHAVVEVAEKGRCLVFSMDALLAAGCMREVHTSPFTHAEKAGDPKGRVCHNLSKRTSSFPSLNESIDFAASDECYPMPTLPLLPDIAEMACKCREANPGKQIAGGTIDVNSAYQQFAQSVETSKLVASQIKIPRGDGWKRLVVIYTVGTFGHSRAGNVYCAVGSLISEKHNDGREDPRSCTYIDDGILVSPLSEIDSSMEDYKAAVVAVFGPNGIKEEKVKRWDSELEAIGWHFDFVTWRVQPKMRGLAKLIIVLFDSIPVGSRTITDNDLSRLQGLLNWYGSGIPSGKAFTASLYQCFQRTKGGLVILTFSAQRDLMWWRALALIAYHHPHVLGADINSVRRNATASVFLYTDASTSIGAGGYLSLIEEGEPIPLDGGAIRWTRAEAMEFGRQGISINVLEYFAAVFYVMLWVDQLRGKVLHVKSDNTAAVAWLMKSRSAGGNPAADAIARLFSLFLLRANIRIISSHIAGVDNILADFRSRDLSLLPQEADEGVVVSEAIVDGQRLEGCSRRALCRSVLYICATKPESMHGPTLAAVLTRLLTTPGSASARSSRGPSEWPRACHSP